MSFADQILSYAISRKSYSPADTASAADQLLTPIANLRGGGFERAEILKRLRIRSVRDLLFHFPRDYQDFRDLCSIDKLEEDQLASVRGTVTEIAERFTRKGLRMLGILITDQDHSLRATWFNQPFMKSKFKKGQEVLLSGKPRLKGNALGDGAPRVQWIDPEEGPPQGKMLPLYPLTEGVKQGELRYLERVALGDYLQYVDEVFPEAFLTEHNLPPIQTALMQLHFPDSAEQLAAARRRFIYQELFILQLGLAASSARSSCFITLPCPGMQRKNRRTHSTALSVRSICRSKPSNSRNRDRYESHVSDESSFAR